MSGLTDSASLPKLRRMRANAQPVLDPAIEAFRRIEPVVAAPPAGGPSEGDPLIDRRDRIDGERPANKPPRRRCAASGAGRLTGNNHALTTGQLARWQMSKKPSIFSLTPPIAWMAPCWLTEPVTARSWRSGSSASADSSA